MKSGYAYVDGSYNNTIHIYGYGGFLIDESTNQKYILQDCDNRDYMLPMRNVAGEICGSTAAIVLAMNLGLSEITIHYDYDGIEKWATGKWKANKQGTQEYVKFIDQAKKKINIKFVKVKGHSGDSGNDEADQLARDSVNSAKYFAKLGK